MVIRKTVVCCFVLASIMLLPFQITYAGNKEYKPFINVKTVGKTVAEAEAYATKKLKDAGFRIVGSYAPYADGSAKIVGFTSKTLIDAASKDAAGGFGAVMRVGITNNNGNIEISYTNPPYIGYAYRIGNLKSTAKALVATFGAGKSFGSEDGMTRKELKKYQYAWGMPYFSDAVKVESYSSHTEAKAAVERSFRHPQSDTRKIWSLKIGNKQHIYGIQLSGGYWNSGKIGSIMKNIDTKTPKNTAALPWEILVSGANVIYLPGKFRIALMFPDLSMGTFMTISDIPGEMDASVEKMIELAK